MKPNTKRNLVLCLLAGVLLLSGCAAAQPVRVEYIGADSAKSAAVAAAGLQPHQVSFSGVDMSTRQGIDYYHVEFTAGGRTYQYDIEALTGTVIEAPEIPADAADSAATDIQQAQPPEESLVTDADTYGPGTPQTPAPAPQTPAESPGSTAGMISAEEAQAIALAHAGITAQQATFVKTGLDRDDGRETYDLEFYTADYREFDYDIDPYTGQVLSFDHDAEYYTPPTPSDSGGGTITADRAKSIALAQVPGATAENIREFETDYDDGRLEYEGKIYYNHMEYEFEIDGYSGAIRAWDVESIYD